MLHKVKSQYVIYFSIWVMKIERRNGNRIEIELGGTRGSSEKQELPNYYVILYRIFEYFE
jgi:hypothetical protein